jgi:hypothetical protein
LSLEDVSLHFSVLQPPLRQPEMFDETPALAVPFEFEVILFTFEL